MDVIARAAGQRVAGLLRRNPILYRHAVAGGDPNVG
jgi:hypothetical protein